MAPGGHHWDGWLGGCSVIIAAGLARPAVCLEFCGGAAGDEEVAVEQSGEGTHVKTVIWAQHGLASTPKDVRFHSAKLGVTKRGRHPRLGITELSI